MQKIAKHSYVSFDGKEWVCKTCDRSLSRGILPVQAKANGMELDPEPPELLCLNALERRLICLCLPFMKTIVLPSGKQKCIKGPAVNVPTKIDCVCTMLPRLPSECELVPLKLKRKLSYKGHYLYDFVSPEKLTNALKWLKANNRLYADIHIAHNWLESALTDDEELVMSMLQQPECMDKSDSEQDNASSEPEQSKPMHTSDSIDHKYAGVEQNSGSSNNMSAKISNASTSNSSDPVSHYTNILVEYARQHGLSVQEVPQDGNCLFSSIAYQLQNFGHDINASSLERSW